jgi:cytochrome P450
LILYDYQQWEMGSKGSGMPLLYFTLPSPYLFTIDGLPCTFYFNGRINRMTISPEKIPYAIPPGPSGRTLLEDLRLLQRNPLSLLKRSASQYGEVVYYPLGPLKVFLLNHPDAIQHVLQSNNRNYSKDTFQYNKLSSITGSGLLTSDGDHWLRQRRLIQPAFYRTRIRAFSNLMTGSIARMLDRWDHSYKKGEIIDVDSEMMRLALEIIGLALFTADFSDESKDLAQAVLIALDHIIHSARNPIGLPDRFPTARSRRYRAALKMLDASVYDLIRNRRQELGFKPGSGEQENPDLLSLLLQARDEESGSGMSDQQLRDEILTLIIAGHETVASALTWTWLLLSQNPTVEEQLYIELAKTLAGRIPTAEDLPNLPFSRMVFEEALRLYPPAWIITRRAIGEDEIVCGKKYRIPAGALVVISPYLIHRHPQFWEFPDLFDPTRFTSERSAPRPRYAYIPFGGGPRLCIGDYFATVEAQLILATIGQRYRLELIPGQPIDPEPLVTLRPRQGLMMKLAKIK